MDPAEHERAERFSSIFGESYGRVHAYAARRVGTDSADDIAAETMLIAWRRRDVLPADPLPWLYGIARNVVARHHEAAARGQRVVRSLALQRADAGTEPGEDAAVAAAWATLGARDRELLALIAWEELPVRDAARVLGCSAATCSVRLHRARRRFERELARSVPAPRAVPDLKEAS